MILLVEDSKTDSLLLKINLEKWFPQLEVKVCPTWMSAVTSIREASFVIIDWNLEDGVNAQESGVFKLLNKLNTPHVVFCGAPEFLPSNLSCEVISKFDANQLKIKMESILKGNPGCQPESQILK